MIATYIRLIFISFILAAPAQAHVDHVSKEDYTQWKQPNGASCCSDNDCKPTVARFNAEKGMWEARFGDWWVLVPHDRVMKFEASDGNAHICAVDMHGSGDWGGTSPKSEPNKGQSVFIYCFVPPAAKG